MNADVFDRVLAARQRFVAVQRALIDNLCAQHLPGAGVKAMTTPDDVFDRMLAERDALEQERDEALLALSALCESCGGPEPHTLATCIAHLTKTLALLQQVREELLKTHPEETP